MIILDEFQQKAVCSRVSVAQAQIDNQALVPIADLGLKKSLMASAPFRASVWATFASPPVLAVMRQTVEQTFDPVAGSKNIALRGNAFNNEFWQIVGHSVN